MIRGLYVVHQEILLNQTCEFVEVVVYYLKNDQMEEEIAKFE